MKTLYAEVGRYRFVNYVFVERTKLGLKLTPDYEQFAIPGGAVWAKSDLEKWALRNKLGVKYYYG